MDTCNNCGKIIHKNKSGLCYTCYNKLQNEQKIQKWLDTGDTGCNVKTTLRNCIRRYILQSQNNKCAICGISPIWNEYELHFILDHIDGNAANNQKDNLRLICPNCDSQLDTYKSKNKNSARTHRSSYYQTK